jgi:hypothetical protein
MCPASDYTLYPFATQNKADMVNLRNVYLDATLSPLLKELDFRQEGWRIENEIVDGESPLLRPSFWTVLLHRRRPDLSDRFQGCRLQRDERCNGKFITLDDRPERS